TVDGDLVTDDTAQAGIEYEYLTSEGVNMPDAIDESWLALGLGLDPTPESEPFVVESGTTQDLTLVFNIGSVLGVGSGITVNVEVQDENDDWINYATYSDGALLSLLGSGGSGEVLVPELAEGTYRITANIDAGISVAGSASVDINSVVTHLDQYTEEVTLFPAEGNLFDNDPLPDLEAWTLSVSSAESDLTQVVDGTTIQGEYG